MASEYTSQGEIAITGTVLLTGVRNGSRMITMRFSNPAAYTLQLYSYKSSTASTIQIYDFTLDAGDVVTDSLAYLLEEGDYLEVFTDVAGTEYYVRCFEG
jgi:hypothetical protein